MIFKLIRQLDQLLNCVQPASEIYGNELVHDEHLFIVTHQGKPSLLPKQLPFVKFKKHCVILEEVYKPNLFVPV